MARVSLVFAPFVAPFMPPLGLPLLSAFLDTHGVSSTIHDLNVELFDRLVQPQRVMDALAAAKSRYQALKGAQQLNAKEAREYKELLPLALCSPRIEREYHRSLALYRRERGAASREDLFEASQVLYYSIKAIGRRLAYFGGNPRLPGLDMAPALFMQLLREPSWTADLAWYRERLKQAAADADVVGFSMCYPTQLPLTLLGAYFLRQDRPDVKIVVGGPYMTLCLKHILYGLPPDFIASYAHLFDAGIAQDGEYPLLDYVQALEQGREPHHPSIVPSARFSQKHIPSATCSPVPPSLLPAFDKMPLHLYFTPHLTLPMLTCRHCYWGKCTFCAHSMGYSKYHRYEPNAIVEQLLTVERKYNAKAIYFMDECIPPRNAFVIAEGLHKADSSLRWAADMRFEPGLTKEKLELLHKGGCRYFAFGLESVNERINGLMNKGTRKDIISRIITDSHASGIHVCVMFFCGFPSETRQEAQETLDFVLSHADRLSAVGMSTFTLVPGTLAWENAQQLGVHDVDAEWEFKVHSGMNRKETQEFRDWASECFDKAIYEGHPLYHRLFYTMPLASLWHETDNPYPLRVTSRANTARFWREKYGLQKDTKAQPRVWPGLCVDTTPFDMFNQPADGSLKRPADGGLGMACMNMNHPLGKVMFLRPEAWEQFGNPEVLEQAMQSAQLCSEYVEHGLVRYDG